MAMLTYVNFMQLFASEFDLQEYVLENRQGNLVPSQCLSFMHMTYTVNNGNQSKTSTAVGSLFGLEVYL